jgi:hypothetical protein
MTRTRRTPDIPALDGVTLNSTALATLLGISRRRVQQLAQDSIIPAPTGYQYDVTESVLGYITFLQKAVEMQGSGSSNEALKAARVALLKSQKRAADLAYQEKAGKLLPIDDVEALILEATAAYVGQRRSMGSRLAGELAGMSDPKTILAVLNQENDAILRTLSNTFGEYAKRG